jgi:protein-S-isoprenylcysteine O-methyltransferase Ste14
MPEKAMTRWGIGPSIAAPSLFLALATWAAASAWPGIFLLRCPAILRAAGSVLIGLGLAVWATGAITVMRAYNRGQLATTGVFALVRHPVYAGWISMIFPGLALFTGAWPAILIALIGYVIFRRRIHHEEEYLERRFGTAYRDYRQRVNAVLPVPRFWK